MKLEECSGKEEVVVVIASLSIWFLILGETQTLYRLTLLFSYTTGPLDR